MLVVDVVVVELVVVVMVVVEVPLIWNQVHNHTKPLMENSLTQYKVGYARFCTG